MYIIYELGNPSDPRLEFVEQYNAYAGYAVGYVAPENESKVDLTSFNGVVLPEAVAKACIFAKINVLNYNYGIKFRMDVSGTSELFPDYSLDSPDSDPKVKQMYVLTEEDKQNTLEFLKAVMRLELDNHYKYCPSEDAIKYADKKIQILKEIDECAEILDANRLMHHRYGLEAHNHQRENEELDCCQWDLSEPGVEYRFGIKRTIGTPGSE